MGIEPSRCSRSCDPRDQLIARVARPQGNILHEPQDGDPMSPRVIRVDIRSPQVARHHPPLASDQGRALAESVGAPHQRGRQNRRSATEGQHARQPLRRRAGETPPYWSRPGGRSVPGAWPHRPCRSFRPSRAEPASARDRARDDSSSASRSSTRLFERVRIPRIVGLFREPAADMVGHDHPMRAAQRLDQVAVKERPGGIAVEHDHRLALHLHRCNAAAARGSRSRDPG